jgi:acid phosphatase
MRAYEGQSSATGFHRSLVPLLVCANLVATGLLACLILFPQATFGSREAALSQSRDSVGSVVAHSDSSWVPNLGLLKKDILAYHDNGRWTADIRAVVERAMEARDARAPSVDKPAIVFDIDETALSNWQQIKEADFGYNSKEFDAWVQSARAPPIKPVLDLYRLAKKRGLAIFFITGRAEKLREATEKNLRDAGYETWDGLLLKPNDNHEPSIVPFKSGERRKLTDQGYQILVNIGDQDSDLEGGYAERGFKIANPAYYVP